MDVMKMVKTWFEVFFLRTSISSVVEMQPSFKDGFINVVLAGIIPAAVLTVLSLGYGAPTILLFPIIVALAWIVNSIVLYVSALALGGKGDFKHFAGVASFVVAPTAILASIPIIGQFAGLWYVYLNYLTIKAFFNFSSNRSAIVIFLPLIIGVLIIGVVLGVIFLFSFTIR